MTSKAPKGAIGGAAAEAGSDFRAGVAAWVVAHGLRGKALPGSELPEHKAVPIALLIEGDRLVDDLEIALAGGTVVLVQAKLRCGVRVLDDVVTQWASAARNLSPGDRLAVATSELMGLGRALPSALRRHRAELAGSPTSDELRLLTRMRNKMTDVGLTSDEVDTALAAAVVYEVTDDSEAAAEAMLDGAVVKWGEGSTAYQVIRGDVLQLARRREGRTIQGWIDLLRSNGLSLTEDEAASEAARFGARKHVEKRHRLRLVDQSRHLDLHGLGSQLPPIPVEPGEIEFTVGVGGPDDDDPLATRELGAAFRRRGRALLTGLPGAGKSTALEHLAGEWAAEPDGPFPLLVHSPDLLGRSPEQSPLDRVIELVCARADMSDRVLLAEVIRTAAATGRLAIILDAVDETRHRRHAVIREIEDLLCQVHADTELIVATRDVGYADSRRLGLPELRLLPPRDGVGVARFVLQALAQWEGKAPTWVDERTSHVGQALDRDRHLAETPLALVSLAILSARGPEGELPTSRASLLSELLDIIAGRWEVSERHEGQVQVGVLARPGDAVPALSQAFDVMANSLVDTRSKSNIVATLAEFFASNWNMPPGPAEAGAQEAVHFWDEAGVIAIAGDDLLPRLAVLGDIGVARYLRRLGGAALIEEMQNRIRDDTSHEALVLAAGLASSAASALVEASLGNPDTELLAARAVAEGAEPRDEAISQLAIALRSRLAGESAAAWRSAKALARLPVPSEQQDEILHDLAQSLPSSHVELGVAYATLRWQSESGDLESLMESVIRSGPPPNLASPSERDSSEGILSRDQILVFAGVDEAYSAVVEASAERLLSSRPELADLIREAGANCSVKTAERVSRLLQDHGYEGIRSSFSDPSLVQRFERSEQSGRQAWAGLLSMITRLDEPAELAWRERRRLDAIADFFASLRLGESSVGSLPEAWLRYRDDLECVVQSVAVLGEFVLPDLSAEASLLLGAEDQFGMRLLAMDEGRLADMTGWEAVDSEDVIRRLARVFGGSHWLARVSASALLGAPHGEVVEEALIAHMGEFPPRNRHLAARIVIYLNANPETLCRSWQRHDDAHIRAAAGWYVARLVRHGLAQPDRLLSSFRDGDASVVDDAIESLFDDESGDSSESRELFLLVGHAEFDLSGWTCPICGEWNRLVGESCITCSQASPDPARRVRRLMEKANLPGAS